MSPGESEAKFIKFGDSEVKEGTLKTGSGVSLGWATPAHCSLGASLELRLEEAK